MNPDSASPRILIEGVPVVAQKVLIRPEDDPLRQLQQMGFDTESAQTALAACQGEGIPSDKMLETCINWLLQQQGIGPEDPRSITCTFLLSLYRVAN